ncbi:MAG TPA: hypothetical protein VKX41_04900 [Alloacidobacterium sp.]|jgi:hypothetical protein|nr:hypothetical protein [Alloacidobacterium sp.]
MPNFLHAAFSALPHVLGDTRALIAYVVAVVGWAAVALKVQRNKNLLFHLRKLPEKDRLPALQMEMGAVPIPGEMTPTQYLTARVHTYYFWAFVIFCILLGAIAALAITYRPANVREISRGFEDALEADRQRVAAQAPNARVQEAEAKIEALQLRRIPEYYIQEFGQPSDKGKDRDVTYLIWITDLYELDMSFLNGRSTEYCVISKSANFRPIVPGSGVENENPIHLGEKAIAELGDTYLWSNFGSAGGSTVIHYGLSGSNAEDNLYGYVADAASPAEYPAISGADQLPQLKPASSEHGLPLVYGGEPINAFAVSALGPQPEGPICLRLPYWEPWK